MEGAAAIVGDGNPIDDGEASMDGTYVGTYAHTLLKMPSRCP